MANYVIRRLLYALPILIGVALLTFVLFYAVVPAEQMARSNLGKNPSDSQIQQWLQARGYDRPLPEQFGKYITDLSMLRFGKSDSSGEDIWERIRTGAPASALIGGLILMSSLFVTLTLALAVAYYRGTYVDHWATFLCVLLMSIVYVVYIIAGQYLFGRILRYFPIGGFRPGADSFRFVLLPMLIGTLAGLGQSVRFYRTVLLEEMGQDYVRTARAKGVGEVSLLLQHVLKNAAVPIITRVVAQIPLLILGSILLESFFAIPGLGSVLFDAISSQDFATVRAMTFLGSLLYIAGLILTDVAYALFDPRIRLE